MDPRIECLNEMKRLEKKIRDTGNYYMLVNYEKMYKKYTEVLTLLDDLIFGTAPNKAKKKKVVKNVSN